MRVRKTFCSRRSMPAAKTACSRASAWYPLTTRTPPSDSVRRPVTSALMRPRSRKMGRMVRKAFCKPSPKTSRKPKAMAVMTGLMRISTAKAMTAVSRPPTKSMRPVPMRLRTPSTSDMMRETSAPTLAPSKYWSGKRPTCSWTRLRSSAMRRWAALESVCVRAKDVAACTRVASSTTATRGISRLTRCLPMTSSTRNFVDAGRTNPATRLMTMRTNPRASR